MSYMSIKYNVNQRQMWNEKNIKKNADDLCDDVARS